MATWLPNTLGKTETYNKITTPFKLPRDAKVFLGPMLLDASRGIYQRYDFKKVCEREDIHVIVRTLEDFERENKLWGGVKAASLEQYQANNITVIDISIRDFIAHFKHTEPDFVKKLFVAVKEIYALQQIGNNVYFHCKAGKNRSFKALTCYLVYVQIKAELIDRVPTDDELKTFIHDTCMLIKHQRPQIIFKTIKQQIKHERFVFDCFKSHLET